MVGTGSGDTRRYLPRSPAKYGNGGETVTPVPEQVRYGARSQQRMSLRYRSVQALALNGVKGSSSRIRAIFF